MSAHTNSLASNRNTILTIKKLKTAGEKFSMLTCYDSSMASLFDEMGIPLLLVGDSAGNTFLGAENTIPVTVDEMIILSRSVVRGSKKALVVADMPFGSFELTPEQALENGIRFLKEAGVQAVKIEGGKKVTPQIQRLVEAGIPVMGHLGLTPQSVNTLGGFRVQGRGESSEQIKQDARDLVKAGIFALVLELVPSELAAEIAAELPIPVIGIGAGNKVDGQVLVWQDLLGITPTPPKLARRYINLREKIGDALTQWQSDVSSGNFPSESESFS
jgi:3-methyl-2-oxobutanoate hydroxymethyltransferase